MKRWIGRWIMAVGVVHMPVAMVKHHAAWVDILGAGVFDVVAGDVARGHAAWFLIAGLLLLVVGALVDSLEKAHVPPPLPMGAGMLLVVGLVLLLMPRSGTWLLLPPALALLGRAFRPDAVGPGR
ncbi:DUF6463 family protein [Polaromonas sp. A23]|uniref:DUF6463 family protein n=1 Tax=Polaromonas sp. A23 TaxID=1944133 RepID=UPI000986A34A|nr:DUF6463 family protein [Polaromonas sp. A23]